MYNAFFAVTLAQALAHYHTNVRRHDDSAMLWDWGLELILQTGPWTWSLKGREWCRGTAVTPLIIVHAHSSNIVNALLRRSNIEQNLWRGGKVHLFIYFQHPKNSNIVQCSVLQLEGPPKNSKIRRKKVGRNESLNCCLLIDSVWKLCVDSWKFTLE